MKPLSMASPISRFSRMVFAPESVTKLDLTIFCSWIWTVDCHIYFSTHLRCYSIPWILEGLLPNLWNNSPQWCLNSIWRTVCFWSNILKSDMGRMYASPFYAIEFKETLFPSECLCFQPGLFLSRSFTLKDSSLNCLCRGVFSLSISMLIRLCWNLYWLCCGIWLRIIKMTPCEWLHCVIVWDGYALEACLVDGPGRHFPARERPLHLYDFSHCTF